VFAPGRFRLLLLSLLAYILGGAVTPRVGPWHLIEFFLLAMTIAVAIVELRAPAQRRLVPIFLAVTAILVSIVDNTGRFRHLPLVASAVVAVFAGSVIWIAYRSVMRPERPVGDRIVGAICVYLLIGLGCSAVYETLDGVFPGSFRFPADTYWMTPSAIRYRYFSFVTLATLGYGDVTPVTALAGTLASMEAIGGQLYIAITVARLVALSLADRHDSGTTGKE
jgi:nitrate/nitrite transporter NarK